MYGRGGMGNARTRKKTVTKCRAKLGLAHASRLLPTAAGRGCFGHVPLHSLPPLNVNSFDSELPLFLPLFLSPCTLESLDTSCGISEPSALCRMRRDIADTAASLLRAASLLLLSTSLPRIFLFTSCSTSNHKRTRPDEMGEHRSDEMGEHRFGGASAVLRCFVLKGT
eukprot:2699166-Rhodomonas_salina.1